EQNQQRQPDETHVTGNQPGGRHEIFPSHILRSSLRGSIAPSGNEFTRVQHGQDTAYTGKKSSPGIIAWRKARYERPVENGLAFTTSSASESTYATFWREWPPRCRMAFLRGSSAEHMR